MAAQGSDWFLCNSGVVIVLLLQTAGPLYVILQVVVCWVEFVLANRVRQVFDELTLTCRHQLMNGIHSDESTRGYLCFYIQPG